MSWCFFDQALLSCVKGTISAVEACMERCGIKYGHWLILSRVGGFILDMATTIAAYYNSMNIFYCLLANVIIFRFGAFISLYELFYKEDAELSEDDKEDTVNGHLYYLATYFHLFRRVQYISAVKRVMMNRVLFFWISLFSFAALQFCDVFTWCLVFMFSCKNALMESFVTFQIIPYRLSLLLGFQGVLMTGGLVMNFYKYHKMNQKRIELLAKNDSLLQSYEDVESNKTLVHQVDSDSWFYTSSGSWFVDELVVGVGYIAYFLLICGFIFVGCWLFFSRGGFLEYYFGIVP